MNTKRLKIIAQWLEAGAPHKGDVAGFDMRHVQTEAACGTLCCIAGAAIHFFGTREERTSVFSDPAGPLLGLDQEDADELFCPVGYDTVDDGMDGRYGAAHAARCIRNLITTGVVDWRGTELAE